MGKTSNHVFVLPGETIGKLGNEEVILIDPGAGAPDYSVKGSVEDWIENIGKPSIGNSRLVFAVSTVLAAPLLRPTSGEGGGVNFVGPSSFGKTTLLHVAASVAGPPDGQIKTCDNTANAFESTAAQHNDACLLLDELGQAHPEQIGQVIYKLAGGIGRGRADQNGNARERRQWRMIFLTTGETDLQTMMKSAGKKSFTGQELRLADVDADAGQGMGIFEALSAATTPSDAADYFKSTAGQYHGAVLRAYQQKLVTEINDPSQRPKLLTWLDECQAHFMTLALPPAAAGQVHRVAKRFGLIAAGGELGTRYGLTGWKIGEATDAALKCFNSWLSRRGTAGQGEVEQLLAQVKGFFESYSDSRFQNMDKKGSQAIPNRVGFKRAVTHGFDVDDYRYEYFITAEQFKKELVVGFEPRWAAQVLIEHKILKPGPDGRTNNNHRLPGLGSAKAYHFPAHFEDEI